MATTTIIPEVEKEIKYNREARDYDLYITIDGQREYIGSAANYSDGETKCRDYAYSYYADRDTPEKVAALVLADESPVTVERKDVDWQSYAYGAAQLDVEEDQHGAIKYITLLIGGREFSVKPANVQHLHDLSALLTDARVRCAIGLIPIAPNLDELTDAVIDRIHSRIPARVLA